MKDVAIGIVLAVLCCGLTLLMGFGTREVWREHDRLQDAENWQVVTGRLESLTIVETWFRTASRYRIECQYSYEADGSTHRASVFDLSSPHFDSPVAAILFVESAIQAQEMLAWKRAQRGELEIWEARPDGRAVRVRHSPRYPDTATLTVRPPLPSVWSWGVIIVLALLTVCFALATAVFAIMPFVGDSVPGEGSP